MQTSILSPSGGKAAENQNTNPNQNLDPQIIMHPQTQNAVTQEKSGTIKAAAAEFECSVATLKNYIKSKKLPAVKANATAAYILRYADVEKLLRDNPGIASKFSPKSVAAPAAKDGPSLTELLDVPATEKVHQADDRSKKSAEPAACPSVSSAGVATSDTLPEKQSKAPEDPKSQPAPSAQTAVPEGAVRKRRHRRRGKGGNGKPLVATEVQPLLLKALNGTTPVERLRITACLNELASLVASA